MWHGCAAEGTVRAQCAPMPRPGVPQPMIAKSHLPLAVENFRSMRVSGDGLRSLSNTMVDVVPGCLGVLASLAVSGTGAHDGGFLHKESCVLRTARPFSHRPPWLVRAS